MKFYDEDSGRYIEAEVVWDGKGPLVQEPVDGWSAWGQRYRPETAGLERGHYATTQTHRTRTPEQRQTACRCGRAFTEKAILKGIRQCTNGTGCRRKTLVRANAQQRGKAA